ncbi:MAG: methyltransferase domain-containing protein [Myxococcaceae bacterium]|nr:MAG: methyltransferase domain-containing protein [Myxococcaceae bacterium]
MRIHIVGGFLGAGKTTIVRAAAERLAERGERVAIVTNDQGSALVDTSLCRRSAESVQEIVGGCFCCRFDELEAALHSAAETGATVALAEAVGSCTDLVATVLAPLAERHPERFQLAPFAVVVDPWRVADVERGFLHDDVAYLFRKQIEEADIVLLSRADLDPPDVREVVLALRPDATVIPVSGVTGAGLAEWFAARPEVLASPLSIDYERYAAAEALLGWSNARVRLVADVPFDPAHVARAFLTGLADAPIAHVKLTSLDASGGRAAIVRAGDEPTVLFDPTPVREASWLVNARVALDPGELVARLKGALTAAAAPAEVTWSDLEAFKPGRPVPQHRYAFRCGAGDEASCCAAFYDRADVRALLGDSWHPGGVELTIAMAERLSLGEGSRVLDVACGAGTSLRALIARWPVRAVGLDAHSRGESADRLELQRGDAHEIPYPAGSFDALLCECALSTFHDQPGALREMRRVLRPGARIAVSDMAVEGVIPEALEAWVHTGTCLSRALTGEAYERALADAGFRVIERWDATDGLRELLRRIKRSLVGVAFAAASGQLSGAAPIDMKYARDVLREADRALDAGTIRYTAMIAERLS